MKIGNKIKCIELDTCLTIGEVYTVSNVGRCNGKPTVFLVEKHFEYYQDHFELVFTRPSMEEQVILAKSYLGKEVLSGRDKFIIDKVFVYIDKGDTHNSSMLVRDDFAEHGYCVAIRGNIFTVPVLSVKLSPVEPAFKMVVLNDTYTAKVTKDTIEVGCQTFPITILDELVDALNSIK